jgi:hypothetical protein
MPMSCRAVGVCPSTTSPTTVAVAGSSDTISEYVARVSRAIASWSHTYGMTEEVTPTPIPAPSAIGSVRCGPACQPPSAVTAGTASSIAAASPSMPPSPDCRDTRCASTM